MKAALALNLHHPSGVAFRAQELLLSRPAQGLPDFDVRRAARRARLGRYRSRWRPSSASASRASTWKTTPARASTKASAIPTRYTYVDLNRCGTPLIEIVSEPDMRSADEAFAYLTELKQTLQFVEVSTCDMEKGHLRCDANVSVRLKGAEKFGTRAEVKNLNSFRFLKQAIDYEIARQVAVIEARRHDSSGNAPVRSPIPARPSACAARKTRTTIAISRSPIWCRCASARNGATEVRASMPELPAAKRARFIEAYGLREYDAQVLTATRAMAEYFESGRGGLEGSEDRRQLGDGRSRGAAESRGQGDHGIARTRATSGRTGRHDRERRTDRQAGEGGSAEDVRNRARRPPSSWSAKA